MKKICLISFFILFLILGLCCLLLISLPQETDSEPIKEISSHDFKNDTLEADIFYKYMKKEWQSYNITDICDRNAFHAVEVDLNDDGENEIIGVPFCSGFSGTAGNAFFILKKDKKGDYKELTYAYFFPIDPIYILRHKTYGYHDISYTARLMYIKRVFPIYFKNGHLAFRRSVEVDIPPLDAQKNVLQFNGKYYIYPIYYRDKFLVWLGSF